MQVRRAFAQDLGYSPVWAKRAGSRFFGTGSGPKKLFGNSQSTAAGPELRPAALRRGRKLRHVVHYNPYFLPHRALREPQSGRHLATIRISKQLLIVRIPNRMSRKFLRTFGISGMSGWGYKGNISCLLPNPYSIAFHYLSSIRQP